MKCLTSLFNLSKSAYYRAKSAQPNVRKAERIRLTRQLTRWFIESRRAAGSRYLVNKFRLAGESVGRYKVRQLMKEAGLSSKQANSPSTAIEMRCRNALMRRTRSVANLTCHKKIKFGAAISRSFGRASNGLIWPPSWICTPGAWWVGRCRTRQMLNWRAMR